MPNALAPVRWRPVGHDETLSVVGRVQQASRDVASVLLASLQRSPRDAISD